MNYKSKNIGNYMYVDADLIQACALNDRKAQQKLYEICFRFLMPTCFRYHKNEEDARAIFNTGFLKILNSLKSVDPEEIMFAAWAKRIMTNTLIDEYRKNKNYKEKISNRDNERELDFHGNSNENNAISNFGENDIMQLLNRLKPATKQVFVMYVIEGFNHREIGELLTMSEGTSKWHLSNARKQLRELLEKQTEAELKLKAI